MKNLITAYLLAQLIRLIPSFVYPWLAARKDFIQIEANGAFDSLKELFHATNVWIRVVVFMALGLVTELPFILLSGRWLVGAVIMVSYELVTAALFWLIFDERLNSLRGLPAGYVGQNAAIDKYMIKLATKFFNSDLERAGRYLKRGSLLITGLLYLGALFLLFV